MTNQRVLEVFKTAESIAQYLFWELGIPHDCGSEK